MLRSIVLLTVFFAGTAMAQQEGSAVKAKELPPPSSESATSDTAAPKDTPQPPVVQPAPAPVRAETKVEPTVEQRILRPSETPSGKRSSKRVAAFWFIVPGK